VESPSRRWATSELLVVGEGLIANRGRRLVHSRRICPGSRVSWTGEIDRAHSATEHGTRNSPTRRAAYDALPEEEKRRLEGLRVHHSIAYSRQTLASSFQGEQDALQGAIHPLVRTIPRSHRRSLYVASHASRIVECPSPRGGSFSAI